MDLKRHGSEENSMSKERKSNKEAKKKAALTPKERKALKKAKKEATKSPHR
jgi:predicted DNA binding protein